MDHQVRKILSSKPIEWAGDLADDCSARWAQLLLRVEWTQNEFWWWAVYDLEKENLVIGSSNQHSAKCTGGGDEARKMAEVAARSCLGV